MFAAWRPAAGAQSPPGVSPRLREQAVTVLRSVFRTEEGWGKVHAAEALLALSYDRDNVLAAFRGELEKNGDMPEYRIGIRRVLAQAVDDPSRRAPLIDEIRGAFLAAEGADRIHAAETLGKLGYVSRKEDGGEFERVAFAGESRLAAYASWVVANSAPAKGQARLAELLTAADSAVRAAAAYGLRHQAEWQPGSARSVAAALTAEGEDSPVRIHLLTGLYLHADAAQRGTFHRQLLDLATRGTKAQRYQACLALAEQAGKADLPSLVPLLRHGAPDVRLAAAVAVLRIGRRQPRDLARFDWVVILLYAMGMLAAGWYYSRRTKTQDDYLLGGRAMRPWAVGLSLFATLLSTISYLAIPGEMIKHGPMIIAAILSYPIIVAVVGWLLIPRIMRLEVTTAYEILEEKLGVSVRVMGSIFFLALRLMWMAVIIYATTSKVLIPLLGWEVSATPYVCAVLGIITVVYTSMGGLRAVVFTDVVQTFILFGGAVLAVVLITVKLGGVGEWWPTAWAPTWDEPKLWFDAKARVTLASACLATLTWHICTAGSDQMAIQRYLATRDSSAARRMYITSMGAGALVMVFLAILGCALFAYFQATPHLIPDGQTISSSADRLFTRYIISGLPPGISGLIIAGLLAAAMSSLSSGINSSCSVITVDFVERFRRDPEKRTDHVRLAKIVSWIVGAVVVVLSSGVGFVEGNLLEVTYKVVNLLVTPLFVLFFMAMFVPRATPLATLAAAGASTAVAVGIAFFGLLGLSFMWIMPGSLVVGVIVGLAASLLSRSSGDGSEPAESPL